MKPSETTRYQTDRRMVDVSIEGVSKVFTPKGRAATQALAEVSLDIHSHEFVAIVGPSGCGKSTLISMVAGLMSPTTGSVRAFGKPVEGPVTEVGYVFQKDLLLPWRTVRRNILLQAELRGIDKTIAGRQADRLLDMTGVGAFGDPLPHELSGGMRQRAAICRALLHSPSLLLMDEPFGALDAMTRDQMNLDLSRLQADLRNTVVFITHSISEAVFLADRVIVMAPRPGRVVDIVDIDLPRPRNFEVRETEAFGHYVGRIRDGFEQLGILR